MDCAVGEKYAFGIANMDIAGTVLHHNGGPTSKRIAPVCVIEKASRFDPRLLDIRVIKVTHHIIEARAAPLKVQMNFIA